MWSLTYLLLSRHVIRTSAHAAGYRIRGRLQEYAWRNRYLRFSQHALNCLVNFVLYAFLTTNIDDVRFVKGYISPLIIWIFFRPWLGPVRPGYEGFYCIINLYDDWIRQSLLVHLFRTLYADSWSIITIGRCGCSKGLHCMRLVWWGGRAMCKA